MTAVQEAFNEPVAEVVFRHAVTHITASRHIHGGDQFDIGRQEIQHYLDAYDMTISTHHLRLHCIVFESCEGPEYESFVPPLVYVEVLSGNPVTLYCSATSPGSRILRRSDPAYLLDSGDVLFLNEAVSISLHNLQSAHNGNALSFTQTLESDLFRAKYILSPRLLGRGAYGSVFLASDAVSGAQLACKVVRLSHRQIKDATLSQLTDHLQRLQREYEILQKLDHPNVIKVEKIIRTSHHVYIFKELILGGDLMSFMQTRGTLPETLALLVVRQVLLAVEYVHGKGVVHRDIKPENVLLTSWKDGARIVLTDFGGANIDPTRSTTPSKIFRMRTVIGTPGYQAPEMFNRSWNHEGYTPAADIWSVGCLAVSTLTGDTPYNQTEQNNLATQFNSDLMSQAHAKVLEDIVSRESLSWEALDFIKKCLLLDISIRPTASQALNHPWFTNSTYGSSVRDVYQRAIANWSPRGRKKDMYELIDTSDIASESPFEQSSQPQGRSKHFGDFSARTSTHDGLHSQASPASPSDSPEYNL